jgi:dihydrodipicolinate synthase/N-acetylneuraminate lyase
VPGLVPGLGNVAPALFVDIFRAAQAGDVPATRALQRRIESLMALQSQGHWLPALKAAASLLGFGSGLPAPPLAPATAAQRRAIAGVLAAHGLLRGAVAGRATDGAAGAAAQTGRAWT